MTVKFFSNRFEFREWLREHHKIESELIVGYYKISSGKPSMTWSESVDEALCFGWIDSVRKNIDKDSYCIRFTPRKHSSNWSEVNIKKVEMLIKAGLMQPEGLAMFEKRTEKKSGSYSYENKPVQLPSEYEVKFRENPDAWTFFTSQTPSYQKTIFYWILSAKQTNTQISRLEKVILVSEQKKRL